MIQNILLTTGTVPIWVPFLVPFRSPFCSKLGPLFEYVGSPFKMGTVHRALVIVDHKNVLLNQSSNIMLQFDTGNVNIHWLSSTSLLVPLIHHS